MDPEVRQICFINFTKQSICLAIRRNQTTETVDIGLAIHPQAATCIYYPYFMIMQFVIMIDKLQMEQP